MLVSPMCPRTVVPMDGCVHVLGPMCPRTDESTDVLMYPRTDSLPGADKVRTRANQC